MNCRRKIILVFAVQNTKTVEKMYSIQNCKVRSIFLSQLSHFTANYLKWLSLYHHFIEAGTKKILINQSLHFVIYQKIHCRCRRRRNQSIQIKLKVTSLSVARTELLEMFIIDDLTRSSNYSDRTSIENGFNIYRMWNRWSVVLFSTIASS